ncbi:MAG: peptidylprolyl isomerase [Brucellaceae bacterium]|nr:peptidylprolyl isomerase [Brucellaceae bacterium]
MTRTRFRAAICALGLTVAAGALPAIAQDDTVVATVAGQTVTEGDLKLALEDLNQQFQRMPEEQQRAAALSAIIEIKLVAAKAEQDGLAEDPAFKRRIAFLRDRALHEEFVKTQIADVITDEEVRARYDKEVAATPPQNEVRARHILVKTEDEAKAIIKELNDGADFAKLADEKSQDKGGSGGDLGYFGPGQMVPEFEKAAFALDVGAITQEPVQSQFGYHIIKVEDKRLQQPPPYEEVKDQMRSVVMRERYVELASKIRSDAEVDVQDPALKALIEGNPAAQGGEGEATDQ